MKVKKRGPYSRRRARIRAWRSLLEFIHLFPIVPPCSAFTVSLVSSVCSTCSTLRETRVMATLPTGNLKARRPSTLVAEHPEHPEHFSEIPSPCLFKIYPAIPACRCVAIHPHLMRTDLESFQYFGNRGSNSSDLRVILIAQQFFPPFRPWCIGI